MGLKRSLGVVILVTLTVTSTAFAQVIKAPVKALAEARRLGIERIARAVRLVARADLDVRGVTALPAEAVLEVLVARLCRLASAGR